MMQKEKSRLGGGWLYGQELMEELIYLCVHIEKVTLIVIRVSIWRRKRCLMQEEEENDFPSLMLVSVRHARMLNLFELCNNPADNCCHGETVCSNAVWA